MAIKSMSTISFPGNSNKFEIVDKLARENISSMKKAQATIKMSNVLYAGFPFEKPDGYEYVGWPFYCLQYDADINSIVFLINCGHVHGENENYDLYMGIMNLDTYEVTTKFLFSHEDEGHGMYSCGFCINDIGEYLFTAADADKLYRSSDKGESWTSKSMNIGFPFGLMQLSNGRYLCHNNGTKGAIYYSDDSGATWTLSKITNGGYENCIIELDDGNLICLARKSWSGTDNGSYTGNKIFEPPIISYSTDYGTTWTNDVESTTIAEMTSDNCCGFYHEEEGLVELFVTSRYPHGDALGIMYQYITSLENAKNDNWGTPKVIFYATSKVYDDYGYIGGVKDATGDMHIMFYDGDSDFSGSCNYKYMKASRNQVVLPVSQNNFVSTFLPYSSFQVLKKLDVLKAELTKKINSIIIANGGTVDDKAFYVTDLLKYDFDYSDETTIDFDAGTITDTFGNVATTTITDGVAQGDIHITADDFVEKMEDLTCYSIELGLYVTTSAAGNIAFVESETYKYNTDCIVSTYHHTLYTNTSGSDTNSGFVYAKSYSDSNFSNGFINGHAGKYHDIVLSCGSDVVNFYIDGKLMYTTTLTDFVSYEATIKYGCRLASKLDYAKPFNFRIYNKALTPEEVTQNYNYFKNNYVVV